ncbi:SpoIIE family protein phosphatase [Marinomonas transparens]|uniref:SpoIIE family protein phosphatase n=1 Tax=Marinomonas transparens TaxID=2795388 RepID=A0A934N2U1_9GAMM|nr:SpoIIE family protein phosphatase [Marinomonas transparens]MBJ7538223.1 SpoIIE family protein phosphatase [Marinomonas transparens]
MKLLCVDSELVYREIVTLCAEKENVEVRTASTFQEAMSIFTGWLPDLVVLDVVIQGGSGLDLVRALKALSGSRFVPMIFLTSHSSDATMNKCFKSGADDFIPKPFNEVLFNVRLKTHMRHVELVQEMYRKNKALTYYQTMIEREHEMAHQVLDHIQNRSENNRNWVAITRMSAASFNGDLALVKTRSDGVRLAFVGDFTGHGLPASIGALPVTQAFFDAIDEHISLDELAIRINRMLFSILPDYMFCAAYLILMYPTGELHYWGGGMPNAFIRRNSGKLDQLQSTHMPLGVLPTAEFESDTREDKLNKGDTLVIVSDGVLELKNGQNEMLGAAHSEFLVSSCYGAKSLVQAQQVMEMELSDFRGSSVQLDDITLVALRNTNSH